jgi:hypothetical protein
MKNQNFIVNTIIIRIEVIDEANRYNPQPTCCEDFLRKVKQQRISLIIPNVNINIVTPALIFTDVRCSENGKLR